MKGKLLERSEIPDEFKWDLSSIFVSDAAWEETIESLTGQLADLSRFRQHLADSPKYLADFLKEMSRMLRSLGKIMVYASSQRSVDTRDQEASGKNARAMGLGAQALAAIAFSEPEMLAIGPDTLRRWVREEPRLAIYEHYFDTLARRQAHVRSSEIEELLGLVMDPFRSASAIHGTLADADLAFEPARSASVMEPVAVAQGSIDALLVNPDRELRRTAWESYADAHLAVKNTMSNCLATGVKQSVLIARARHYSSVLEASLANNHIPTQVYHNVVDTFYRNLPLWHRYWRIRRQALGYDRLHVYDVKAPLTATHPQVPFEQAVDWICEGMSPLGDEYVSAMRRGILDLHWVDVYPNQGKTSGAFSGGTPGTTPLVLMSYTDDLDSLSTLAHELGHSMHSYYTWQSQPMIYADYTIFVAEVASNLNQALVREYLFQINSDPGFEIALIEEAMSNFFRYFFVMPTLARFELEIHQRVEQGGALTADGMIELMADLFREGYGGEVEIDQERVGITWAQFHTHLYYTYYVYQYTTGLSAAQALADALLKQKPGAVESYLAFLRAGDSIYPLDVLRLARTDLTTPEPIETAFAALSQLVERLATLLDVQP